MKWKELSDQWHKYLKKEYWPDIANRDPLEDMSEKLTDHKKNNNFYNVSPSISPDGSTVALLSDRSGYFDVYLLDVLTGKKKETLIKGSRSVDFEELKWLQPGLSWSPDGEKIVLAVKAGATDALHIVNIKSKKSILQVDINRILLRNIFQTIVTKLIYASMTLEMLTL